ncbi:MAG: hypothetical protein WC661_18870 [Opitutaceae bacterium]|jgi:hypothetical protein
MDPLEIALRLKNEGSADPTTAGLNKATAAANLLAEGALKGQIEQEKWNRTLAALDAPGFEKLEADLKTVIAATEAAGNSADDLKFKLQQVSDAKSAAPEIQRLAAAQKEIAESSIKIPDYLKKSTSAISDQAEKALKGTEAIEKLNGATNGSIGGILNLGRAIKGLGAAFAANPVLAAISTFLLLKDAAMAAGGVLGGMIVKARGLADAFEETRSGRVDLTKDLESIKKAGDTALTKIATDAKAGADSIDRLNSGVAEALTRLDALAEAALKAKLAELDLAEAQALVRAKTEEERTRVTQEFDARKTVARADSAAGSFDRNQRFQTDRRDEAGKQIETSQQKISAAENAASDAKKLYDATVAKGRGQRADSPEGQQTLNDLTRFRAELEAATKALAAVKEAEGKNIDAAQRAKQEADTALEINAKNKAATENQNKATEITEDPKKKADLEAAKKKDADKTLVDKIGTYEAPVLQEGAQNIGRGAKAKGDTDLFDAAKALNDAAQAAREGGTTTEEVKALAAAGKNLETELKKRNEESAAFKAQLAVLANQLKTLGGNSQ